MKVIAKNKKASFNYEILEIYEAGISLVGTEVKSIREGRISLKESYAEIREGEVYLLSCHISPYEPASRLNHDPLRERKLLLHRREIKRLIGKIKERGYSLIPTKVLFSNHGKVKVEIALARGKKVYQKREALRQRDRDREMKDELRRYQK
jgi:SsrA-binding protein